MIKIIVEVCETDKVSGVTEKRRELQLNVQRRGDGMIEVYAPNGCLRDGRAVFEAKEINTVLSCVRDILKEEL